MHRQQTLQVQAKTLAKEIRNAWASVAANIDNDDSETLSDLVLQVVGGQGTAKDIEDIRDVVNDYDYETIKV